MIFILFTAYIIEAVAKDPEITRACRDKQEIAAFMDDYKTHASSKKAAECIKNTLVQTAGEIGLSFNIRKCGTYSASQEDEQQFEEAEILFLLIIRKGYEYLGLYTLIEIYR